MTFVKEDWHLSKSVPVSLIFAFMVQAGMFIYSYAQQTAQLDLLQETVAEMQTEIADENLRQWSRINANQNSLVEVSRQTALTDASIIRVEKDISTIQKDVRELNELLRDYFREGK